MDVTLYYTLPGHERVFSFTRNDAQHREEAVAALFEKYPEAELAEHNEAGPGSMIEMASYNEYVAPPWSLPELLRYIGVLGPLGWILFAVPSIRALETPGIAMMTVGAFVIAGLAGLVAFVIARILELLERIASGAPEQS